jgi:hypothetical protein
MGREGYLLSSSFFVFAKLKQPPQSGIQERFYYGTGKLYCQKPRQQDIRTGTKKIKYLRIVYIPKRIIHRMFIAAMIYFRRMVNFLRTNLPGQIPNSISEGGRR